ncbi:MAG: succinate dehydrogenase membrane anchor subunit [Plesiomonas sp.]
MVTNATAFGRSGVHDWLLLRATAIIMTLYILYLLGFIVSAPEITYGIWKGFFSFGVTQVFTLLAVLSVLVHVWIGLWQVLTDYIKPLALRLTLQFAVVIVLLVYVIATAVIVWGV